MIVYKQGYGLLNFAINKLPFELHLPGYQYCGPGTKLNKRLARGDSGINPLDAACKAHDIAYQNHTDGPERTKADRALASEAWKRAKSKDASVGERAAAIAVTAAMKAKIGATKIGRGLKKLMRRKGGKAAKKGKKQKRRDTKKKSSKKQTKRKSSCGKSKKRGGCSFKSLVAKTRKKMKTTNPKSADDIVRTALSAAKEITDNNNGIISRQPRIIPIPKSGGVLPLVPIFAGLSALGSLAGGASAVYNAIRSTKESKEALSKKKGRRQAQIAIGKSLRGDGVYLRPYRKGYGIYLKPFSPSKN